MKLSVSIFVFQQITQIANHSGFLPAKVMQPVWINGQQINRLLILIIFKNTFAHCLKNKMNLLCAF
jgi:hypothetical protein